MKSLLKVFMLACALLSGLSLASPGFAQTAPDVLVKHTVGEVLAVISRGGDRVALVKGVEEKAAGHFDFTAMTRMAMGHHWRTATPDQQRALESAFHTLLLTTYTQALMQAPVYQAQVEVRPLTLRPDDNDVAVKTVVRESSGQALAVDYRLARVDGEWKVYDVAVESLSLVSIYRDAFGNEISRSGIDGLIQVLATKNRQNGAE